jgi:hypothetical protein
VARSPHAIPATFFSAKCDGRVCHADHVGVPLTRASRSPHNQQVADRCTSIAPSRDSRKQLIGTPYPDSGGPFG